MLLKIILNMVKVCCVYLCSKVVFFWFEQVPDASVKGYSRCIILHFHKIGGLARERLKQHVPK